MARPGPVLLFLICCATAFAAGPEYTSLRQWVEDQNPKDQTPAAERIFVNHDWKESAIVQHHPGLTLQAALDQMKFRDRIVSVYRAGHKPAGVPVYDELTLEKPDRAGFMVQPLDVIYLWNGNRN